MSNHLQHITAQAKRIRKANPSMPWTECISQASKQLGYGAGVGRKPKYKVYARAVTPGKRKAKAKKEQLLLPAPKPMLEAPKRKLPKVRQKTAKKVVKKTALPVMTRFSNSPKKPAVKKPNRFATSNQGGTSYGDYISTGVMNFIDLYDTKYYTDDHKLAIQDMNKGYEIWAEANDRKANGKYYNIRSANQIVPLFEFKQVDGKWKKLALPGSMWKHYLVVKLKKSKKPVKAVAGTRSRKILSVDQFDKFARSKGFNPKFADTDRFVEFMFKYSKDLFGRASLKGMSWNTIYALNPMSADWISWSKIDTDSLESYIRQYSTGKRKVGALTRQQKLENKDIDAYNWFVVSQDGEIDSGWEYKSDAMDHAKEHNEYPYKGKRWSVISLRTLKQRGLEDPRNRWKHVGSMSKVKSKIKNIGNITLK